MGDCKAAAESFAFSSSWRVYLLRYKSGDQKYSYNESVSFRHHLETSFCLVGRTDTSTAQESSWITNIK